MIYPSFRCYGGPPYEIVMVHGGPGAPGEMGPVAERLSQMMGKGVLEPLQKASSLEGQIAELRDVICQECQAPVTLIGWSWGAMLGWMMTAHNADLVKKLILVSSGPFESHYAREIMPTRLSRLSQERREELEILMKRLDDSSSDNKKEDLKRYAK